MTDGVEELRSREKKVGLHEHTKTMVKKINLLVTDRGQTNNS